MQELVTYEHLRELQHFAKLGRMSASLLHEISNPLTAALLNLEVSGKQSAGVRRAQKDMRLMRRYIEAARQQVRMQAKSVNFRLQPQLDQLKRVMVPLSRKAEVRLDIGLAPDCRLYGDPVKFQHIIANLVVNAIEAYAENSYVYSQDRVVRLRLRRNDEHLILEVTDWGKVIDADILPRLFETFYTTKDQPRQGLGIGLAIVRQYVTTDFGGSIRISSSRHRGTRFTIKLPLRQG